MEKLIGYIDFDGVILDTETGLFDEYHIMEAKGRKITREQYLSEMDWNAWIEKAPILRNSVDILKNNSPRVASILTTIHSFEEGKAKVDFLRSQGVKNDVIVVPFICRKHEIVNPRGKFLIDDFGKNLVGWKEHAGIPFRFSVNTQKAYDDFVVVSSIQEVFDKLGKSGSLVNLD